MLFTIGQVTKMYDISHDTLRYYDKIDLLKPSVKKENGYRYYTIREIELLEIILIAKQLEIPIKDIKDTIEKEDENSYIELFEKHNRLLQEKIDYLQNLRKEIQNSIHTTIKMRNFENDKEIKLNEEYINKKVIYFSQNDYGHFGCFIKEKNLIFKINDIDNKTIIADENMLGFEIENEIIDSSLPYKQKEYIGSYITLTIKENIANIEKYIIKTIEQIYGKEEYYKNINIFIECMFTLFKRNNESIYFVKIYIENKK